MLHTTRGSGRCNTQCRPRRAASANALIGVATAAWFPSLTLNANTGYRSNDFTQWFSAPAQFWSLGPQLAALIFDGGARQAQISQARAQFDLQTAVYRQTVLNALQEVENVKFTTIDEGQSISRIELEKPKEYWRIFVWLALLFVLTEMILIKFLKK
jgi:hypothetical protein